MGEEERYSTPGRRKRRGQRSEEKELRSSGTKEGATVEHHGRREAMKDEFMLLFEHMYSTNVKRHLFCSRPGSGNPQVRARGPDKLPRAGETGVPTGKTQSRHEDSCGQGDSRSAAGRKACIGRSKSRARKSRHQQNMGVGGGWCGRQCGLGCQSPVRCQCGHKATVSH